MSSHMVCNQQTAEEILLCYLCGSNDGVLGNVISILQISYICRNRPILNESRLYPPPVHKIIQIYCGPDTVSWPLTSHLHAQGTSWHQAKAHGTLNKHLLYSQYKATHVSISQLELII